MAWLAGWGVGVFGPLSPAVRCGGLTCRVCGYHPPAALAGWLAGLFGDVGFGVPHTERRALSVWGQFSYKVLLLLLFRGRAVVFRIFAIETLLACTALNFQAGGTCCNSAKRELEIIAKPLRLLHESLLSGRSFLAPCAQKLATTLCPCSLSPAVCQFVLVAARRFLQSVTYFVGRSARAPSCRFAFAAFDLLVALV